MQLQLLKDDLGIKELKKWGGGEDFQEETNAKEERPFLQQLQLSNQKKSSFPWKVICLKLHMSTKRWSFKKKMKKFNKNRSSKVTPHSTSEIFSLLKSSFNLLFKVLLILENKILSRKPLKSEELEVETNKDSQPEMEIKSIMKERI